MSARFRRLVRPVVLGLALCACHAQERPPERAADAIDIYDDLFSVSVVDARRAVAAGYHGSVYVTRDGGASWFRGRTPTRRALYSVSMADAQSGWAVGQRGTILRSEDGGASWAEQASPRSEEGRHLFGVYALDGERAWAVGEWGARLFTEDGGRSWQDRSLVVDIRHPLFEWLGVAEQERVLRGERVYEDVALHHVSCLDADASRCWIAGEFGTLLYTGDGGRRWGRGEIVAELEMDSIPFAHDESEPPEAAKKRLAAFAERIADVGQQNVLLEPFVSAEEVAELYDARDPTGLFELLAARLEEVETRLEDAGIPAERLRSPHSPPWDYPELGADDPDHLERYVAGRTAVMPQVRVVALQSPVLFSVRFENASDGLAAGLGGVLLRSSDGGRSWVHTSARGREALFSVAVGEGGAVAVGENGLMRISRDGGTRWSAPSAGDFPRFYGFMRDLGFDPSRRTGFAIGQGGTILRSLDGGTRWARVLPPRDDPADHGL